MGSNHRSVALNICLSLGATGLTSNIFVVATLHNHPLVQSLLWFNATIPSHMTHMDSGSTDENLNTRFHGDIGQRYTV